MDPVVSSLAFCLGQFVLAWELQRAPRVVRQATEQNRHGPAEFHRNRNTQTGLRRSRGRWSVLAPSTRSIRDNCGWLRARRSTRRWGGLRCACRGAGIWHDTSLTWVTVPHCPERTRKMRSQLLSMRGKGRARAISVRSRRARWILWPVAPVPATIEIMLKGTEVRQAQRRLRALQPNLAAARPDLTKEQGADSLPEIEHIVVLMMENHSYDNYFGMLAGRGEGFHLGADGEPTETNKSQDGSLVPLTHFAGTVQVPGVPTQAGVPATSNTTTEPATGFVRSIEQTLPGDDATVAMRFWSEEDLPFYYGLAKTFPLATRWFSSCLGPTFPNRRFLIAGTAHGLIDDLPFGMIDYPKAGTIFDLLTAHQISWVNYHNVPPWQINFKRIFHARGVNFFRLIGVLLSNLFPSLMKSVQSKVQCTADLFPLGTLRSINHLRTMRQLFTDARNGTLPSVSIIDPDFGKWSEENPQDIHSGESSPLK